MVAPSDSKSERGSIPPPRFVPALPACAIHQNTPQLLRCHRKEMTAIFPVYLFGLTNPKIRFMDDGSSLQRVFAVLATHLTCGDPMQLAVHQLHELIPGLAVAVPPAIEKTGNSMRLAIVLRIHYTRL